MVVPRGKWLMCSRVTSVRVATYSRHTRKGSEWGKKLEMWKAIRMACLQGSPDPGTDGARPGRARSPRDRPSVGAVSVRRRNGGAGPPSCRWHRTRLAAPRRETAVAHHGAAARTDQRQHPIRVVAVQFKEPVHHRRPVAVTPCTGCAAVVRCSTHRCSGGNTGCGYPPSAEAGLPSEPSDYWCPRARKASSAWTRPGRHSHHPECSHSSNPPSVGSGPPPEEP